MKIALPLLLLCLGARASAVGIELNFPELPLSLPLPRVRVQPDPRVLETTVERMAQAYAESGQRTDEQGRPVVLGGSPYRIRAAYSARNGNPLILIDDVDQKHPSVAIFFNEMKQGGARRSFGQYKEPYIVSVQSRGNHLNSVVVFSGATDQTRVVYRSIIEATHRAALKLTPRGDTAENYAVWVAPSQDGDKSETLYILVKMGAGARYVVSSMSLHPFRAGKPVPVYINSYDMAIQITKNPVDGGRAIRFWNIP